MQPHNAVTDLCVVIYTVCIGEDAFAGSNEAAGCAAILPLALPWQ